MSALELKSPVDLRFESAGETPSNGHIAIVTMNRPQAMNALDAASLMGLSDALSEIEAELESKDGLRKDLRCVILTGAGEKAFVAGADILRFEGLAPADAQELAESGQTLFSRIEALRVPVIAAVNGFALGGGLELALACDFIYAAKTAKMGLPECTLGLMPGFGGIVRLARRVGLAQAREIAFTGAMVTADFGCSVGLVNRVCELGELMAQARATAQTIASRAPLSVAKIKSSLLASSDVDQARGFALEAKAFGELFSSDDQKEGVRAFIEKRKPTFHGK